MKTQDNITGCDLAVLAALGIEYDLAIEHCYASGKKAEQRRWEQKLEAVENEIERQSKEGYRAMTARVAAMREEYVEEYHEA